MAAFGIPPRILVAGAGSQNVNHEYFRDGDYEGRPKWSAYNKPPGHKHHRTSKQSIYRWEGRWYIVRWATCMAGGNLPSVRSMLGIRREDQRYSSVEKGMDLPPTRPEEWKLVEGFSAAAPCPSLVFLSELELGPEAEPPILDGAELEPEPEPEDEELDVWLAKANLSRYGPQVKEYGYDTLSALRAATEADIVEMTEDADVGMKKPHRRLFTTQWQALVGAGGGGGGGGAAPSLSGRTFATSHYKREYQDTVPINKAAQIIGEISRFIYVYCRVHGCTSESDTAHAESFVDLLQQEAGAHADGGAGDLMAPVRATAELLWTSASKFRGMGEHEKEFCSLLNRAIREDDEKLAPPTAALSRGINAMLVEGRGNAPLPFPPGEGGDDPGTVYRGGGFDDSLRGFFTVGKVYRQPAFLATSFLKAKAEFFRGMAQAAGYPSVLWVIHVDPAGEHDVTRRCKHVNFVGESQRAVMEAPRSPLTSGCQRSGHPSRLADCLLWMTD
jgi:hypothetical protein